MWYNTSVRKYCNPHLDSEIMPNVAYLVDGAECFLHQLHLLLCVSDAALVHHFQLVLLVYHQQIHKLVKVLENTLLWYNKQQQHKNNITSLWKKFILQDKSSSSNNSRKKGGRVLLQIQYPKTAVKLNWSTLYDVVWGKVCFSDSSWKTMLICRIFLIVHSCSLTTFRNITRQDTTTMNCLAQETESQDEDNATFLFYPYLYYCVLQHRTLTHTVPWS